jgi:hypothetical protein
MGTAIDDAKKPARIRAATSFAVRTLEMAVRRSCPLSLDAGVVFIV